MTHLVTPDFTKANCKILKTTASDGTITVPTPAPLNLGLAPTKIGSLWLLMVAENSVYINQGSAADNTCALHPVGRDDTPKRFAPGTVLHFVSGPDGDGTVTLIPCYPVE